MNYLSTGCATKVELPFTTKVRGRYKIEAVKPDGSKRLLADWFSNLITDNGLNLLGTGGGIGNFCLVGSGNTAPSNSDTTLVTFVASTSTIATQSTSSQPSAPYFGTTTKTYRFAIGVATGNLSEVGLGPNSTNTSLFSRALILDGGGSPTTITVLSSEALDVTYQLQQFVPTADVTGSVTINAVSYAYTARAANSTNATWQLDFSDAGGFTAIAAFNGTIGAVTGSPSGSAGSSLSPSSQSSYTAGTKRIDSTFSFGLTDGNLAGGVSAVLLTAGRSRGQMGQYQVGFTPALPKDSSHTMTLVFRHSWDRH